MMKLIRVLLLTLVILASIPSIAEAARRKKKEKLPPATEVSLPVPQSDLPLATYLPPIEEADPVTMEIGISTWTPSGFSRGSRTAGESDFKSGSIPMISINRMGVIGPRVKGLHTKFGVSFAQLTREVQLQRTGGSVPADQDMSLASVRLGVEYRTRRFFSDVVQPFAGVAALPTVGLAARSPVESNVTTVGVPFELAAGASLSPSFMPSESIGVHRSSIGLGLQYLFGSVGGSRADGLGVQGSLRVDL